ncbi:MAG: hypothetical protein EPN60_16945 [Nevskiaceae bacterium]|nr:MAG: hypothetical protein EPN60_16945 [Nevskiaceae bacterium]
MSDQLPLDFATARRRRDSGIARAADHADAETPGWTDIAFEFLEACAKVRAAPFLAEDVIEMAKAAHLPEPPDGRAWGGVFQRAARRGVISKIGFAPAKTSNCSPKVQWVSRIARAVAA